jgi:hypothetical protein
MAITPILPTNSEIERFFQEHNTSKPGSEVATAELIITTLCNQQFQGFCTLRPLEYHQGYQFANVIWHRKTDGEGNLLSKSFQTVLSRVDHASGKIEMCSMSSGETIIWSVASVAVLRGSIDAAMPESFLPAPLVRMCVNYIDLGDYVPRPAFTVQPEDIERYITKWPNYSEPPAWISECLQLTESARKLEEWDAEEYHSKPLQVHVRPLSLPLCNLL